MGDPDVMDTWATSSLTPHIAGGWETDDDLWQRVFPMDLCTHAHDIIRTWLFSRVVRAHFENHVAPWPHAMISGFVARPGPQEDEQVQGQRGRARRDPGRSSAPTPSAGGPPGAPGAGLAVRRDPDEGRPSAGDEGAQRKRSSCSARSARPTLDLTHGHRAGRPRAVASWRVVGACDRGFDAYDYTTALETTEKFFWTFCDDYLELVKERAYGARRRGRPGLRQGGAGARAARQLRLLAPFLPYVTEEVWSWWQEGSIHRAAWPTAADLGSARRPPTTPRSTPSRPRSPASGREVQRQGSPLVAPSLPRSPSPAGRPPWRRSRAPASYLRNARQDRPGDLVLVTAADGTPVSVDVELADRVGRHRLTGRSALSRVSPGVGRRDRVARLGRVDGHGGRVDRHGRCRRRRSAFASSSAVAIRRSARRSPAVSTLVRKVLERLGQARRPPRRRAPAAPG